MCFGGFSFECGRETPWQSGEVVLGGFFSFGFLGVCSFSGVSVGLKKYEPLLCPRLSLDLCACLGVGVFCVPDGKTTKRASTK